MLLVALPATAACAGSEEESDRYKLVVFPVSWGWNLCILDLSNGSTINMNRTRKESRIESARFSRLHSVIRIPSFRRDELECIKVFKAKIVDDDEEGALECLGSQSDEEVQAELLHLAVNNRKNDFVRKVLETFPSPSDQTDGVAGGGKTMLEKAVLFATLNDDPETLEDILSWAKDKGINLRSSEEPSYDVHCPLLYACLKNYTKCISILHKHEYRVVLPSEDKKIVDDILTANDYARNDYHFYMKFWVGDRHVDQFYRLDCAKLIKEKKRPSSDTDPVERFLRIKAFSNPHYIATEFVENCADGNCPEEKDFRHYDPIRKSLLLARYSKLLSHFYVQYSQEYLEISKRCEELATSLLDHCDSMKDVKTILEYSISSSKNVHGHDNENTNWHLALHTHHKSFVGHHYYQSVAPVSEAFLTDHFYRNFLWEKITGTQFHWEDFFLAWKMMYFPFALFLFFCLPFIVLIDAVFRKADILFVSPEMMRSRNEAPENVNDTSVAYLLSDEDVANRESESLQTDDSVTEHSAEEMAMRNLTTDREREGQRTEYREDPFFGYFRKIIHRPILRIITYHIMEFFFLISLSLTLIDPLDEDKDNQDERKKEVQVYDYITLVFIVSQFIVSLIDLGRRRWQSLSSFWQIYNILNSIILGVGGLTAWIAFDAMDDDNRADMSGNSLVNVGSTIFAVGASMSLLKPLRWFLLNRTLGPVVVCIIKVLKDAFNIFRIFLVVFGAFSITSFFMFKPFYLHNKQYKLHQDDLVSLKGLFGAMFWRVFDAGQPQYAAVLRANNTNCTKENTNKDDEYDINCVSSEFSHLMGMTIWAVYQAITVILLINILIAMMNTTYHRIWESSDTQWKYSKSFYQIQFLFPRAVLPSPFRFVYYIAKWIYICKKRSSEASESGTEKEKYQNYKQKLIEIVRIKVHSDYENSIQDDFTDLKQDLKNHISEKQKTSVNTFQKDMKNLENSMESSDDKFDGLKNEIVSLQRELKDLKESKNKNYELEEELKDIKNLLKTLLDQKSGQEKTENKEKITE